MKRKRKRLIDQLYNGAFKNLEFTQSAKNVGINSILIIFIAGAINYTISKRNERQ
jgi:hypothetical protein